MSRLGAAYLELTKPGITLFIGITAAAGFVTAVGGWGMPGRLLLTVIATMMMSAGAATLNQVVESRWDALMRRTATRPLPSGLVSRRAASRFGWGLSAVGFGVAVAFLPAAAAVFLLLCHISYVFVYTPLKRRTPLCTLAGAIPGALPVLAGWTAAGRPVDAVAIALTGVLFMWQIPHFLAIGWMAREDYRSAGCPMLSVVDASGRASARVSAVYAVAMLFCSVVLALAAALGPVYVVVAFATGMAYVVVAGQFARSPEPRPARRLFFTSLFVLPLQLAGLVTDLVVG